MFASVTVSLVPEARGGPFIFWDDLAASASQAAALGFSGIEIFGPSAEAVTEDLLRPILGKHNLKLAALGTGAGWLKHRLSLTSQRETVRRKAVEFILTMVKAAAPFHASVIIGSMQGRHDGNREEALNWLRQGLKEIGKVGLEHGVNVLYEPLNRYETNLINQISEAATFVESINLPNVQILADLFHMNIEERSIPEALITAGKWLGHLHFVDSNRRPAGCGHIDLLPVFSALRQIQYDKFVSAEALPYPNPLSAARITMESFTKLTSGNSPKPVL